MAAAGALALALLTAGCTGSREVGERRPASADEPMARYIAERLVDPVSGRFGPALGEGTGQWVAVAHVLGSEQTDEGADVYFRYIAGYAVRASDEVTMTSGESDYGVAHVEDADVASGPVTFSLPGLPTYAEDLERLIPRKFRDVDSAAYNAEADALTVAWQRRAEETLSQR